MKQPRFFLLQIIKPHYHQDMALKNMKEMEQLVTTCGGEVAGKSIQHRVHPHPNMYVGVGKVEWLRREVVEKQIAVVVVNGVVKSGQLYRLEKALWSVNHRIQVWDRVDLILNIFERRATTIEAKLQIELARITHQGPRIYGLGKTALSRQGGGIGTRGSGETNIEKERRVIKERQQQIRKELGRLSKQKQRRIRFRKEQGIGPVALVGYTSAGKTSLFNVLTGKEKRAHKGLFTTLDTVVGKMKIAESPRPVLISDTIGFIEDLPPLLIEAFRSTLLESLEAEVILHVIDVNDSEKDRKIGVVEEILRGLKIEQPVIKVFNKVDLVDNKQETMSNAQDGLLISAKTGVGIGELKRTIVERLVGKSKI